MHFELTEALVCFSFLSPTHSSAIFALEWKGQGLPLFIRKFSSIAVTFVAVPLCKCIPSSSLVAASSCHSKRVESALDPWGLRALYDSLSLTLHSVFVLTGGLIKLSGSDRGPVWVFLSNAGVRLSPVMCVCVHMRLTSTSWVLPRHSGAIVLLLPAKMVWSVFAAVPSYVGWMVSTTLSIWCQWWSQAAPLNNI